MNIKNLLKELNDKQREAVSSSCNHILVLAGAGSGKTKVLVNRIAWLLMTNHYNPNSVMAVTFTNKASEEMKRRIEYIVGNKQEEMWIGTFHGLANRLLHIHYEEANLPQNFQILDKNDQCILLKNIIQNINLDENIWNPQKVMWYINNNKDNGIRPDKLENYVNIKEKTWRYIYQLYQEMCDKNGLVDFSEILLRSYELLLNHPYILHLYRKKFKNILIDEFQDTSYIQYNWVRILASNNNIMIVGDDDQSIYSWRGARIENIQQFLNDFHNVQTIRLEQNYRSTNNILQAANTLISNNKNRLGKKLWTKKDSGEPINFYCASNEIDEAYFIVNILYTEWKNGKLLKDYAILYRNNSQSRVLEDVLLRMNLPYCIYNGTRFFERKEIKDVLAYCKLILNRNDDIAFERAISTPSHGIGKKTFNIIKLTSHSKRLSFWQSSDFLLKNDILNKKISKVLQKFLNIINDLEKNIVGLPIHLKVRKIIRDSGLWNMYEKKQDNKNTCYIENLEEFISAAHQFKYYNSEYYTSSFQAFLDHIAVGIVENNYHKSCDDVVRLMTLHASKGLEFSKVFISGMEEETFPGKLSCNYKEQLEEERRLAYVGITRAMKKLTITYSKVRHLNGKKVYCKPSRFIKELFSV